MDMQEFFGEPISVYTRQDAIDDGVLMDVSQRARLAGFTLPVAITSTAFAVAGGSANRLHDVLAAAAQAALRADDNARRTEFTVMVSGDTHQFAMAVSGGDDGEPVITIMLPNED